MISLLNKKCTVYRQTTAQDDAGSNVRAWTAHITDLPCRIRTLRANERQIHGATGVEAGFRIYCSIGQDIRESDQIEIGGTRYNVVLAGSDSSNHHMQIDVELPRK